MTKKRKVSCVRILVVGFFLLSLSAGTIFLMSSGTSGEQRPLLKAKPFNPEFIKYLADREAGRRWPLQTEDGHFLGLLPSLIDYSYLKSLPADSVEHLPASYDLRTKNKLTSVKDQGDCGSCWSFATLGSLESLLKPKETWDFSEQNMIDHHGFDYGPCKGGLYEMAIAYLARWEGPINETDDPYIYAPQKASKTKKHVQNVVILPARSSSTDNTKIKSAVTQYGAVAVSMLWSWASLNKTYNSFYNPNKLNDGGHAVCIVGWNDNFPKNKFNSTAPGNGAFIVRNSWGAGWGEKGYFYVSYYDPIFAKRGFVTINPVFKADPVINYGSVYQYDPLGLVTLVGTSQGDTLWCANIFSASANASLKAVSFYAMGNKNNYEIYIYTGVTANQPRSGTLGNKKTGSLTSPGYFTIPLGSLVPIKKGQRFSIVVKLKTTGLNYPIPVEYPEKGYSSKAKAKSGQSFISLNGSTWDDVASPSVYKANTNVCVKAFTKY